MDKNELTNTTILYVIAITMLSTMAFVFVVSTELPQKAVGQAEEVFSENATFIQEMEGGSPTVLLIKQVRQDKITNQTGEAGQAVTNQTGEAGQAVTNQTGEAGQAVTNQTGEAGQAVTNQTGEAGQAVTNQTGEGDILSSISEGLKGLFGMK